MFTGIVEEIGEIKKISKGVKSSKLLISADKVLQDTKIGDSICTNGVCLTVTNIVGKSFEADVMSETLNKSNLGLLKVKDKVNLERALTLNTRLGGHLVSGHIDGVGKIAALKRVDNSVEVMITAAEEVIKYIVLKGSIAIDGVSLTVAEINSKDFKVCLIPHTAQETILLSKQIGQTVNLECDIVGKYIERLLNINQNQEKKSTIDINFLSQNGFL